MEHEHEEQDGGRRIAWFDVETTGLGGADDGVGCLEAAVTVTDQDLRPLASEHVVLRYDAAELEAFRWDDAARAMHEGNGLLLECQGPDAVSPWVAERRFVAAVARGCGLSVPELEGLAHPEGSSSQRAPLWGGVSPHLDRGVVRRVLPGAYRVVHYRTIDVIALRLALELWHGLTIGSKAGPKPHRAVPDVARAIELASEYRRLSGAPIGEAEARASA